jgi:sec-independent protein translocase protein TatC
MFTAGVAFAYFLVMPSMLGFLYTFGQDVISPMPRLKDFISLSTRLLLIIGLIFELPVITTFLAKIGILRPEWLSGKWKIAIVVSFIVAAVVTPTPDPINCTIVATPMIVLYFMCIWLAKLVYKRKKSAEEQDPLLD